MTEVGVSLALRRHRNLIGSTERKTSEKRKRLRSPSPGYAPTNRDNGKGNNHGSGGRTKKNPRGRVVGESLPSYSSWRILFEGAALYMFCMILPNLLGTISRLFLIVWREGVVVFYQMPSYICSQVILHEWKTCQKYLPDNAQSEPTNASVLAPDAGISDFAIVILLSLSMAVTRVSLVHFLVPNYKQPKRLEALVRCKSMHLLSSSYSGSVTPTKSSRIKSFEYGPSNAMAGFCLPNLKSKEELGCEDEVFDYQFKTTNDLVLKPKFPLRTLSRLDDDINVSPSYMNKDPRIQKEECEKNSPDKDQFRIEEIWSFEENFSQNEKYDDDESQFPAPAVSSGLLTSTSAQNLQDLLEQAAPVPSSLALQQESLQNLTKTETTDRIFAAPKYATAVFRLIFCLLSCLIGFCYFREANFWPPAVGGTGNTKNCWDLSSVGVDLMHTDFDIVDSDFDSYNPLLRRYYLIQASYHFHSAVFHVLTSILLWFVSKSSKKKELSLSPRLFGYVQMGIFTLYNVRIFFQHMFSLVLILGTYLFSSTRRLGVIAMFSFDASSLFLHLLQLGINAPRQRTSWSRKSIMLILYRFLVVPAFCYARFYVFPFVVGYSAMEESQDWLQQLENMLMPGTAKFIHGFFVIAFLLFMLMNLVYFWRLLNHPHVIDALQRQRME